MEEVDNVRFRTIQIVETCCRCLILFILDFILNGSFVSLIVKSTDAPTPMDLFFAYDRSNMTQLWSSFSWTGYFLYSFVYFSCIAACLILFLLNTVQLVSFIRWAGPLILSMSSIFWLNSDETLSQRYTIYHFLFFMTYPEKLIYVYGFSIRLAYGVYVSRLYVDFRSATFENLPIFFLKMPFFTPLLSFLGFGRAFGYLRIIHLVYLHIPSTVAEVWLLTSSQFSDCYLSIMSTYRYNKQILRDFGVQAFLIQHWTRLRAPSILRTFWISRFCFHIVFVLFSYLSHDDAMQIFDRRHRGLFDFSNETVLHRDRTLMDDLTNGARYMTVRSCETIVAVLGTTGVVSSIGHFVGELFETFLQDARDDERNAGALTGVLFLILCLQTNVTGLSADKRVAKLYRNIWLLSMALLHFVHHSLNNLLVRLTTVGNFRYGKHLRALTVSAFLLTAPFLFLLYAWPSANDMFNPWILSVAIFAIELVVKMAVTLVTYFLNIVDAKFLGFNPKMDEFVYCVRSCGAVLEFLFGILLFFDGLWILFFEQSGFLRAFMICVHAYCNIYLQALEGWSKLRRRRTAASKLSTLQDADEDQIRRYNDVCCICYQDNAVGSTKITVCQHFFHSTCLQKWLYVQDKCPLCHKNICMEHDPPTMSS